MERSRAPFESAVTGQIKFVERFPEQQKSSIPVLISPGWSENPRVFVDVIDELVRAGRHVIALKFGGNNRANDLSDFPAIEVNRAVAILDLMKERGIEKAHGLGHSEGGIPLAIAASLQPKRFKSIVLSGTGGMIGQDTLSKLLGRFSKKIARDAVFSVASKGRRRLLREGTKYIFRHPVEGLRAARAISHTEIHQALSQLRSAGVKVGIMAGVKDPVFPMRRLQTGLKSGDVDEFLSLKGGHDRLHTDRRYTRAAEKLLTAFEK